MKYTILLIVSLLLVGCTPEPPIEPVTAIYITPEHSEIGLNESIELFCFDQSDRQVSVVWDKHCNAGTLSTELGTTCVYTTPKSMTGVQLIYAHYNDLMATTRVKGVK